MAAPNVPPINPQGNQMDPTDAQILLEAQKIIEAEKLKALQAQGLAQPDPAAPPPGIPVKIGNQEVTFKDPAELSTALSRTLSSYEAEIQKLRAQAEMAQKNSREVTGGDIAISPASGPKFEKDVFVDLMSKDKILEALDYADKARGRMTSEEEKELRGRAEQLSRQIAAYQFQEAHPEYPGGNQAAVIVEAERQALGLPFTAEGLEAAYLRATHTGKLNAVFAQQQAFAQQGQQGQQPQQGGYQPPERFQYPQTPYQAPAPQGWQQQQTYTPSPVLPQNPYLRNMAPPGAPPAPPMVPRGSADVPPDLAAMADDMSVEQLGALLRRFGS